MLLIYRPIVEDTHTSFELEVPSQLKFWDRVEKKLKHYPWLVCEWNGEIAGYAYAGEHREREAYQWVCETSVYVSENFRRKGVGRALYTSLLEVLILQGYCTALAGIAAPNDVSVKLHFNCEFRPVGLYENIGYKLGKWQSVNWWARKLRGYPKNPEPPAPLTSVKTNGQFQAAMELGLEHLQMS